jgi:trans-aconitate 2-methyltransferase
VTTRDWDAKTYERVSIPQQAWGLEVLKRLPLRGDETVLDAGCGTGRLTAVIAGQLPRGRVIAVDASESMVERARATLGPGADVRLVDLLKLELEAPVDAIFSNAVFHWIPDHDQLFARLYEALKPGGRLVAQCGGAGNVERFHGVVHEVALLEAFEKYVGRWAGPWNFASPDETAARLERAGFSEIRCSLAPHPFAPPEARDFMRTVCLGHHLERLPEELRDPFVETVHDRTPKPVELDYVRLNIDAQRPTSAPS